MYVYNFAYRTCQPLREKSTPLSRQCQFDENFFNTPAPKRGQLLHQNGSDNIPLFLFTLALGSYSFYSFVRVMK